MQITTKFNIFETVTIKGIDFPGKIIKIIVDGNDLRYSIEYWAEYRLLYAELYEDDIDIYKKGFGEPCTNLSTKR